MKRITAILALVGIVLSLQLPAMALTCATADCSHLAAIGDTCYDSIQAAVDAAPTTGDTLITILRDDTLVYDSAYAAAAPMVSSYRGLIAVEGKSITIDLNGKKLICDLQVAIDEGGQGLIAYFATNNNGHLTLKDSSSDATGTLGIKSNDNRVYSLLVNYGSDCSITVESGNYTLDKATSALIYGAKVTDGVVIKGGTFTLGNVNTGTNRSPWIINISGQGEYHAAVSGGTFNYNVFRQYYTYEVQDPDVHGDWDNVTITDNGNGTWTVTDDPVAWTVERITWAFSGELYHNSLDRRMGFLTLKETIAASHNGEVTMLADCDVDGTLEIDKDITIDPASYTINWTGNDTDPIFTVKAGKTLDMVGAGFLEPKRAGYNFHGWYTDENCTAGNEFTGVSYGDANTTADISLWAKWEEKEDVSITSLPQSYNYDGGAKAFSVIGSPDSGYKVEYKVGGSWTETAPSASGVYDVRVSRPEDSIYKAFSLEIARGLVINGAAAPEPEPTPSAPARENPNTGVHK